MNNRSVSQLKSFTRCGEQYRLNRTLDLPESPAAWTAVGTAFHEAYEQWEHDDRDVLLADLADEYYREVIASYKELQPNLSRWTKAPRVKDTQKDIDLRGANLHEQAVAYEAEVREGDYEVTMVEYPFEEVIGGVNIRGKVDCILKWGDGRYTIRDLKTGAIGDTDNRQLGLYGYVVNNILGLDVTYGEYWYTKFGKSGGWVNLSRYTKDYLEDQYGKLDTAIEQEIYLPAPGKACQMCDVKSWCREFGYGDLPVT